MNPLKRFGIDTYMLLLLAMVLAGVFLPAGGALAAGLKQVTWGAVWLLFFLYGAKLDPRTVRAELLNWRLQGLTFGATYLLFPLLGIGFAAVFAPVLGPDVTLGLLFLSVLPSTVQSSIAFTALAGGNVPGAICAASVSNLIGVALTPLLVTLLMHRAGGGTSLGAVAGIGTQILLPFALGQILRPRIGGLVARHKRLTMAVDRGSILLIVYAAFSAGTIAGLWQAIPALRLILLAGVIALFLALGMAAMVMAGRACRLPTADRAALFYCGATKSIATGLPIAAALFPADQVGAIVLPAMLYHMSQLLVCAFLAQRGRG
ncbi:bile acid:sodium symporter family protein [Rhodobacter capsulatus]|uniref:Na+-dependent transporter n=1 Tax=Rhodobacter capsulatus (strain ATCC BAA-309 / NBRC 16581 / SB1003) TaxID=272942 RepID=D5AVN8_RHOCB|nr:bile acid:sodium symporter family protein [Rhodobacter capsulatus]ADE87373.1 Na+-dependent transporter [Rhodobacter capsulatus SB 1003]ETE52124.1 membrane protein [Rhodobacter capsulatus Y262]MDS0927590.1 bile acid:sodium symporter [Rhodobacter capsulatus]